MKLHHIMSHHHKINHKSLSYHNPSIISLHLRILTYNLP